MATDIIAWWGDKTLAEIKGQSCRDYVKWRTAQPIASSRKAGARLVQVPTARHELGVLGAAVRYWHREHGPLTSVPVVTLPPKSPPRDDYFWTRQEAAARIRVARRSGLTRHLVRFILIGLYSGTRPGALIKLRWLPSTEGGWIDVDNEIIHRRPLNGVRSRNKRQPPARIHKRLLPHLRAWRKADLEKGITNVIHYGGRQIRKPRRAWDSVRTACGSDRKDGPHVLRHTAATWYMNWGVDVALISGFLGMSVATLLSVYGHHSPHFQDAVAQATPKKPANRKRTG